MRRRWRRTANTDTQMHQDGRSIGKWVPLFDRVQATSVRAREKAVSDSQLARRLALSGSRSAGQQSELAFVVHTLAVKLDDEGAQTVGFLA
ncbi:hypothetical protein [Rhizobium leguminosarum]|nr:hypothetical protein [Rhizobium leguminosarum]